MPLAKMAEATGAAVVCLRHLTKSHTGNAIYAGGGGIGIVGAARAVLLVAADPDDENKRVLAVTACNLTADRAGVPGFQLVPAEEHGCARVQWNGSVDHQADDLVTPRSSEERSDLKDAVEWLRDRLVSPGVAAKTVEKDAKDRDISIATLRRAKKSLKVVSEKVGGAWFWRLPILDDGALCHDDEVIG